VVFFSIFGKQKNIPSWSYLFSFMIAILGAGLYFLESSGYTQWLGDVHKYTKLLIISLVTLITGCASFFAGQLSYSRNSKS